MTLRNGQNYGDDKNSGGWHVGVGGKDERLVPKGLLGQYSYTQCYCNSGTLHYAFVKPREI